MHKYWRHIGDYAKDTKHLTMLEHGALTLMLDWAYASERPLPEDERTLFRLCSAFDKAEREAVITVRDEFFELGEEGYTQRRVLREIAEFRAKAEKASASAAMRWQKDRHANAMPTECERNANAMRTHSDGNANGMLRARVPTTNNQQPATTFLSAPDGAGPSDDGSAQGLPAAVPTDSGQKKKKGGADQDALAWAPEGGWTGFTGDLWDELSQAYPACDIRRQMLAMEQWLKANPAKARKSNWRKFVTSWLAKEQDRGGDLRGMPQPAWSGLGAKKEGGALLTIEHPPVGYEQAMAALFGEEWQQICPAWPQMTASDKSQVRAWLREHGEEAA